MCVILVGCLLLYSHILCGELAKDLRFWLLCIDKNTRNPEASCNDLLILSATGPLKGLGPIALDFFQTF